MRRAILGLVSIGLLTTSMAHANQPWYADVRTDVHEPWSFSPLLGVGLGGGSDRRLVALELVLRWRYGKPPGDRHGAPSPRLIGFGVAVASSDMETIEPSAFVGFHLLPSRRQMWSQRAYLNLRADVGAGYRFEEESSEPIAYAKLALGALLARPVKYQWGTGERSFRYSKDRFRTEFDLVVKTQVGRDGDWAVVVGVELDPFRIGPDSWRLVRGR